jgi:hypothetical protein
MIPFDSGAMALGYFKVDAYGLTPPIFDPRGQGTGVFKFNFKYFNPDFPNELPS